jgi:hypothetical protein
MYDDYVKPLKDLFHSIHFFKIIITEIRWQILLGQLLEIMS